MKNEIRVLLVNEHDEIIGEEEKLKAHELGLLHRAFSIFLVAKDSGKILIQRRARSKYHSGGLLSNSCCSHPYAYEEISESLKRCVRDELGVEPDIGFEEAGTFTYFSDYGSNHEHEIDHVYVSYIDTEITFPFNRNEIEELYWLSLDEIDYLLASKGFTSWFREAYKLARKKIASKCYLNSHE